METNEHTWLRTVERNGQAHAIRFLAALEQFETKSCARCAGLLLSDWCYDLESPGEYHVRVRAAFNAGIASILSSCRTKSLRRSSTLLPGIAGTRTR
jgi:hypothetical protein